MIGLIFEKINGYKDGSFFTPGFITMYMCRETLRRAVVQKFNEAKVWKCEQFEELYNKVDNIKEANEIINSLKICDPAVGSGHFLVSALNELIAIKSELGVLTDREGKRIRDYDIKVENDELIVSIDDQELFEYKPGNKESQRVQEALFHEKETLIESCLFGVDINANSVKICRLRLWIELLKNAYYTADSKYSELETLPNIDINIKRGNSLISRFALDEDLSGVFKKQRFSLKSYQAAVEAYKDTNDKKAKAELLKFINDIKDQFRTSVTNRDPRRKKLSDLRGQLALLDNNIDLFGEKIKSEAQVKVEKKRLKKSLEQKEKEIADIENAKIYQGAFEWRFEFPEVLDDKGNFLGFDVVIGTPPYIRQEELKEFKPWFKQNLKLYTGTSDIYVFFVEKGFDILKQDGSFTYIMPNKYMQAGYGKPARQIL